MNYQAPSHLNPLVDPRLDLVLAKALQPDPKNRYQSALDFQRDLDRVLHEPPVVVEKAPIPSI